jgi:putative ABC transport system permease protein
MATNKWEWNNFYTYLQLKDKDQASKVNETISAAIKPHLNSAVKDNFGISFDEFLKSGNQLGYTLQPINSIHLNSHFNDELESNADVIEIIVLGSMALLILLTAVTNYINYTTATSSARSKEITIKKVLGASRGQLIAQHIFDSFVFSVASLLLAIFLVMTFLKDFNLLMGKEILPQAVFSPELILFYFVLVSVVTILAGIFPGIHFIKFAPTSALRAEVFTQSRGGSNFRNALVFFQYFVSFILVVSSLIIYQQLDYVQNKSLGFDNKNVLVISIDNRLPQKRHVFKDEILKLSDVQSASITTNIPSYNHFFTRTLSNDKKNLKDIPVAWAEVDDSYFKTLQMEIQEGRVFSIDRASDSSAILLNEAAARILSVEGQLGDYLSYNNDEEKYQIIGIVKDFHFESFHNEIRPVAIKLVTTNDFRDFVLIKTRGKIDHEMIARVQGIWNTFLPGASFEYNVLEETGDALLDPDRKFARLINLFSILALIISIVGSSALASYVAEKSLKEISIRKVLGASSGHITFVLNRKFLVVILAAFLLAFPVAYYVANKWLENFAFRVNFSVGMFVGGCIFVTLLSLVFINFQYYRAIRSNPVKYIR